jgi:undecaprenyl phosphate-alpha-L-ara4FN deformylase
VFERTIGLNVHVDTFEGMRHGVPRLLDLFNKHGVRVTFFVPMGKDNTGRTLFRAVRHPGLFLKARRGNAVSAYGLKTLLRGILVPGPEIAKSNGDLLHRIVESGHELGIHGLDHIHWHDHIRSMSCEETERTLSRAVDVYKSLLGTQPRSFAAPGWMINGHALGFLEQHGFTYSADTRGSFPFFPRMGGRVFKIMQIPLTMPTLDEVVGLEGNDAETLARFFLRQLGPDLSILAVHTEFEGKRWRPFLDRFIGESLREGYRYERLADIAAALKAESKVHIGDCIYGTIRGRAAEVTIQVKKSPSS